MLLISAVISDWSDCRIFGVLGFSRRFCLRRLINSILGWCVDKLNLKLILFNDRFIFADRGLS